MSIEGKWYALLIKLQSTFHLSGSYRLSLSLTQLIILLAVSPGCCYGRLILYDEFLSLLKGSDSCIWGGREDSCIQRGLISVGCISSLIQLLYLLPIKLFNQIIKFMSIPPPYQNPTRNTQLSYQRNSNQPSNIMYSEVRPLNMNQSTRPITMTQQPQTLPFLAPPRQALERHIVKETTPQIIVRGPSQEAPRPTTVDDERIYRSNVENTRKVTEVRRVYVEDQPVQTVNYQSNYYSTEQRPLKPPPQTEKQSKGCPLWLLILLGVLALAGLITTIALAANAKKFQTSTNESTSVKSVPGLSENEENGKTQTADISTTPKTQKQGQTENANPEKTSTTTQKQTANKEEVAPSEESKDKTNTNSALSPVEISPEIQEKTKTEQENTENTENKENKVNLDDNFPVPQEIEPKIVDPTNQESSVSEKTKIEGQASKTENKNTASHEKEKFHRLQAMKNK